MLIILITLIFIYCTCICVATVYNIYILYLLCTGIEVDYKGIIAGIPPGPMTIRCLLLCWTGDHPAQCEIGKFLGSGGHHACRRDKLQGAYVHTYSATACM